MKKFSYWLSSFTWGILGTLIGLIVFLFFKCFKKKSDIYKGSIRTNIENFGDGGCFSIGIFTFVTTTGTSISNHEFGHCIQNAIWGPLVFFVVLIPSVINYWYCYFKKDWSSHDKMWCERNATELGDKLW